MRVTACIFFFFNDTATTEIYTLSLHDALPISAGGITTFSAGSTASKSSSIRNRTSLPDPTIRATRSEEHTSELQSRLHLVCRLLLEKKKKICNRTVASLKHREELIRNA